MTLNAALFNRRFRPMNVTTALTGALPAVVILSTVLTAFVSVVLLRLYRRAVVRAMQVHAGVVAPPLI
jgi:hypothetical protein